MFTPLHETALARVAPSGRLLRATPAAGPRSGICARPKRRGRFPRMSLDATSDCPQQWEAMARRAADRSADGLAAAHAAFGELHAAFGRQLAAWLSARVGRSDLDEVHQEIWVRVWERLPAGFAGGNFRAWLFTIARNHLVDSSRRRTVRRGFGYGGAAEEPDPSPADPDGDEPWQILVAEERGRRLRGCLDGLDTGRRRVIVGRLGGEEYDAIAEALRISKAQAQSWLFVAKRLLQECLAKETR